MLVAGTVIPPAVMSTAVAIVVVMVVVVASRSRRSQTSQSQHQGTSHNRKNAFHDRDPIQVREKGICSGRSH